MEIVSDPHPTYTTGMVPIISRFSIRKQVPRLDKIRKGGYRLLWVFTSTSVQVSPENTRVSVTTQEDYGISDRFEIWGNPALERLSDLLYASVTGRVGAANVMGTYRTASATNGFYQQVQPRTYQTDLLVVINEGTAAK